MKSLSYLIHRGFSSAQKKTSVYIWTSMPRLGPKSSDLKQQFSIPKGQPQRIKFFDDLNIQRILFGQRHSAALTGDGKLYLFGSGNWGILGQGTEVDSRFDKPVLVDYFVKRNQKVKEVALGEYHTVVLTEDGQVYTWGYGGKVGMFQWMFSQQVGALGHGDKKHHFQPKKVEYFEKHGIKISKITAGLYHTVAMTDKGDIYTWGRGQYGVLGNGSNSYSLEPELNGEFEYLKKEDPVGKEIVKFDSADEYTGALMKDGTYYVWGKNDRGQMGVGSGIGIDMVESENVPRQLIMGSNESPVKIKDFNTGMNTMMLEDVEGNIYKVGLKLDFVPNKLKLMEGFSNIDEVSGMSCGTRHYVLWNNQNQIFSWGNIFKEKPAKELNGFGLYYGDSLFEEGKIKQLSMKYAIFGALVEHDSTPGTQ